MDAPRSRIVYLRVTAEDHARLQQLAARQERKVAQVIYRILRDALRDEYGPERVAV